MPEHADYGRVAAVLREIAAEWDAPADQRAKYMARNKREHMVARHYRAYGLRYAAELLEAQDDGSHDHA